MKKTVFITGATGTMGMKTVEKFVPHTDEFNIRVLARDSAKNREKLSTFGDGIEVIWGDLKDDEKLRDGVKDADYVLAIGAFLSPFCDEVPYDALRTNYGSTLSMLKSIKEFGQEEKTHFVYIGTVAQTGDRMPPIHWGRVGDPMKPSVYDYYAVSKVFSEMAVMESGLKYWASIRQSSMMPVNPKSGEYPILSHQPYNNVLEWSTAEDSANLMLNICMKAPEHFWRRAYNLSNGKDFRCTTFSFYESLYQDPRETQEPNWLATNNFHGHCYLDSDDLENVVPFRTKTFDEAMFDQLGAFMENAMNAEPGSMPTTIEESKENNRRIMSKPGGVLQFVADGDEERIKVWFGNREKYDAIPKDWDGCIIAKPLNLPGKPLDRGFDESKPVEELGIDDMRQAAKFRGGECLSESMDKGDLYSPLKWRCADGHEFEACPYTVLFAGHWCPECMQDSWHYGDMAKKNPFFAQVWWPLHNGEEPYSVKMEANARDIEKLYKREVRKMAFDKLLSPIKIRGLELKNRIIMTGMGTKMNDQSAVTDMLVNYHAARAAGGVALNTLEVCSVDAASAPKNFVSIAEDRLMPGHKKLTDAIHANGGKANIQLWQGALAVGSDPDAEIIFINDVSTERIMEIIENYGKAAKRAVDCGYDVVELHAAHNYLPHMFLSGGMNFRDDEWGGSLENRMRFPLKVIESIRRNIPEDMPMFMRVDCFDDYLPGGLTIEEVIEFCKRAGKAGVDVLDISRGNFMVTDALIYETPPMDLPHFYNVDATERIRRETGMLAMPTGRFNFPDLAEQVLEEDKADLVVMARAQIADPQFVNKLRAGKLSNIKYCIGCNQGCHSYFLNPEKPHISCLRNPAVGEEAKYIIRKTEEPKKILILGGGMAGLEAADLLHDMGHTPVIYEESDHLGGQFLLAGKAPRKADIERAVTLFGQNAIDLGVEIHMNTKATADTIKAEKPDAVIVAIGSSAVIPPIPGADKKNVLNARDVMAGTEVPVGKTVIVGGGLVGIECAEYLAVRGHSVTIIEMRDEALTELDEMRKIGTRLAMEKEDITIQLNAKCKEVLDGKVIVDVLGEEKEFDADNVLMAVGARPRSSEELVAACDELGIPYYVVGDAKKAGFALDAVYDAFHACFDIQDKETNA